MIGHFTMQLGCLASFFVEIPVNKTMEELRKLESVCQK